MLEHVRRLAWFVALWLASVATLGIIGAIIKAVL